MHIINININILYIYKSIIIFDHIKNSSYPPVIGQIAGWRIHHFIDPIPSGKTVEIQLAPRMLDSVGRPKGSWDHVFLDRCSLKPPF